jgi:hypothetical protein
MILLLSSLGNELLAQGLLRLKVSGSLWNIHEWSLEIALLRNSHSFRVHSRIQCRFRLFSSSGRQQVWALFTRTFLMPKSWTKILRVEFFLMLNTSAIILIIKLRKMWKKFSGASSVLQVLGRQDFITSCAVFSAVQKTVMPVKCASERYSFFITKFVTIL